MVDSAKLKAILVEKNLRQEDVAKALGISTQTFNYKINNKSEFLSSEIAKLCEILGVVDEQKVVHIFFARNVN